jgi:hypothetical protein
MATTTGKRHPVVAFSASPEEVETINRYARSAHRTVSSLCRHLVLRGVAADVESVGADPVEARAA